MRKQMTRPTWICCFYFPLYHPKIDWFDLSHCIFKPKRLLVESSFLLFKSICCWHVGEIRSFWILLVARISIGISSFLPVRSLPVCLSGAGATPKKGTWFATHLWSSSRRADELMGKKHKWQSSKSDDLVIILFDSGYNGYDMVIRCYKWLDN